jgi:hypothetical protein
MDTVNGSVFLALILGLILAVPLTGAITGFFKRKVEKMIDSENDFREIVVDPELILNPVPFPGIQKLADPVSQPNSDIRSWRRYLHHIIPGLVVCFMIHYSSYPHDGTVVMMMVLYMFLCASFPLLFVIYVLKPSDSTYFGKALTIYFLAHILFIFYFLSRNPFSSAIWVLYIFILNIGPTLIFFLLNSRTTLRTITPFIFPVIFIGAIFLVLAFNLMISNQAILETVFNAFYGFFDALNIHGFTSFALFGSLLVLFAGIAIAGLVLFRLAYNSKTINNQILLIDCL